MSARQHCYWDFLSSRHTKNTEETHTEHTFRPEGVHDRRMGPGEPKGWTDMWYHQNWDLREKRLCFFRSPRNNINMMDCFVCFKRNCDLWWFKGKTAKNQVVQAIFWEHGIITGFSGWYIHLFLMIKRQGPNYTPVSSDVPRLSICRSMQIRVTQASLTCTTSSIDPRLHPNYPVQTRIPFEGTCCVLLITACICIYIYLYTYIHPYIHLHMHQCITIHISHFWQTIKYWNSPSSSANFTHIITKSIRIKNAWFRRSWWTLEGFGIAELLCCRGIATSPSLKGLPVFASPGEWHRCASATQTLTEIHVWRKRQDAYTGTMYI